MIFCDTSTLAKYYVVERESAAVRTHLDAADQVMASALARAELMAVFHRRLREKKWSRHQFLAVTGQFFKDDSDGFWSWVPLDDGVIEQATRTYATLPGTVFLRTADCLHLVTALRHGCGEICTHDIHQIKACPALGLRPTVIV
jgi:predicted nucleic acid-binding protein